MKNPTPNLDYNAWASWRGLLATLFLCASVPVFISLTGCTALRYADVKPDGTKTTFIYASLEVFRERSVTGSYSPTNGVDLSITRRDTLTPDKVEAISKGVIAGMKAGI